MSAYDNNKLARDDGTQDTKNAVSLNQTNITNTSTIMTSTKRKNRRNLIIFFTLLGLNIVLVILIIWQIASIFSGLS